MLRVIQLVYRTMMKARKETKITTPCTRSNFLNPLNQAIYRKTTPIGKHATSRSPISMSDGEGQPLRESLKRAPLQVRCRRNVGPTMAAARGSIYNYFIN